MLQELCGGGAVGSAAFSLLFPVTDGQFGYGGEEDRGLSCGGAPVDCTLSLGTPSTRRAEVKVSAHARHGGGGDRHDLGAVASCNESGRGRFPARRRCANCDTTSTPLWRNGPRGPKSLCNACGIRYKKEERRAAAAATTQDTTGAYAYATYARHSHPPPHQQWGCYGSSGTKPSYGDNAAVDGPCLSWMLNVMPSSSPAFAAVRERPTLFQYY